MSRLRAVIPVIFLVFSFIARAEPDQEPARGAVLTLQEAVLASMAHSPDVRLAQIRSAQAGEAVREMRSLNRPQVTMGTGLAYNNGFPLSIEGAAPSIVQVGASQAVLSKKNRNLILEAEQSRNATEIGAESARNELAARVALVYYDLHRARKAVALWSNRLAALEKERQVVENLLQAGRMRPLDLTLARTAVSEAVQQQLASQERARLAELELRQLADLPQAGRIETAEPVIDEQAIGEAPDALFRRAVETHPEILRAQANVRAREFHVEAEKGERYPQASLVSQYAVFSRANNYQDFFRTFTRNNFLFGLSLQYPVFDGSRAEARIGQSRREVETARLELEKLKSRLKLDLEKSASALKLARGAVDLARETAAASRESMRVDETLLEAGRIGYMEMQNSRAQLLEKEIEALEAERTLFQRKIEILRATGSVSQALAR